MADLIVRGFAVIGVLTTVAVGAFLAVGWLAWRREVNARNTPLPAPDLPAIPPAEFMALHEWIASVEAGETP